MNQLVPQEARVSSVAISTGAGGASIAPQNLGEVVKFAEVMCRADIALPKHLRGNAGACMAIAIQALEWQMSPFAVASKSYSVNGTIAYEAQLIAAVVNTRSGIKGRLKYEYIGEGDSLSCKVTGILDGDECSYETPPLGSISPKNSPLWKVDPRQQLAYYGARSWARRYCPEVILGVYDRDEAEHRGPDNAKDVTPSVMQRLKDAQARPQAAAQPREGFSASVVDSEAPSLPSGPAETIPDTSAPADGSGGAAALPSTAAADDSQEGGSSEEGDNPGLVTTEQPAPSSGALSDDDRAWLVTAARTLVPSAAPGGDPDVVRRQYAGLLKMGPKNLSKPAIDQAVAICRRLVAVCEASEDLDLDIIAGLAKCDVREIRP